MIAYYLPQSRQKIFGEELGERLFTRMEGHAPMEVDNEKEVYRTPERAHNRETVSSGIHILDGCGTFFLGYP